MGGRYEGVWISGKPSFACSSMDPPYPKESSQNSEIGTVTLRIIVDDSGKVQWADVSKSSGHERLDQSAIGWIYSCRFKPPEIDGNPTSGFAELPITFELPN
jgi:protein TonB